MLYDTHMHTHHSGNSEAAVQDMITKKKSLYNNKSNKNILEKLVKKAKLLSVYHNIVENDEREAYTRNWHIAFA